MEQYLAYVGTALGTLLALWVAYSTNKKSKVDELQQKTDKARDDYVGTLEKRIKLLEEDVRRLSDERDFLRRENYTMGMKIAQLESGG